MVKTTKKVSAKTTRKRPVAKKSAPKARRTSTKVPTVNYYPNRVPLATVTLAVVVLVLLGLYIGLRQKGLI